MRNSFLVSKFVRLLCLTVVWGCSVTTYGCHPAGGFGSYKEFAILPLKEELKADSKWASYLWRQSARRVTDKNSLTEVEKPDGQFRVYVHIDPSLHADYAVRTEGGKTILTVPTEENMLWLVYQWIARMAEEDDRWQANDLEPAIIGLNDGARSFDFAYRSIYSPSMANPDVQAITANRHVDYHWGLWGHNLRKVFGSSGENIPETARALVAGKRIPTQWCFSSDVLYKAIESYILENYGDGIKAAPSLFAILPDDNHEVCQCDLCRKAGNTSANATPAVTSLLRRLAVRFPAHSFYTSAYATTVTPPAMSLPENVGVILSAIDLPLSFVTTQGKAYQEWTNLVTRWQKVTQRILVWDYMRNFDDYLTPYPCLGSIQNRLRTYKRLGIWGVFFNGSGDDYSTFDDVQSFVLSSLLKNTELDVPQLVKRFFHRFYPHSGDLLAAYYLSLEDQVHNRRATLEWYGGISDAVNAYLSVGEFQQFYIALDRLSKTAGEEERRRLNQLLTALNFTQLELIRSGKNTSLQASEFLDLLKGYKSFPNWSRYKEANGLLDEYVAEWQRIRFHAPQKRNKLSGQVVSVLASDGNRTSPVPAWTDGYYGFPHDYHLHWVITSQKEWQLVIPKGQSQRSGRMVLSFLHAPAWKIGSPSEVKVFQGEKLLGSWKASSAPDDFSIVKAVVNIKAVGAQGDIKIIITSGHFKKMACDEIEWYEGNE